MACGWVTNREYAPKLCPNCGKGSTLRESEGKAEELIKEISEIEQELGF